MSSDFHFTDSWIWHDFLSLTEGMSNISFRYTCHCHGRDQVGRSINDLQCLNLVSTAIQIFALKPSGQRFSMQIHKAVLNIWTGSSNQGSNLTVRAIDPVRGVWVTLTKSKLQSLLDDLAEDRPATLLMIFRPVVLLHQVKKDLE